MARVGLTDRDIVSIRTGVLTVSRPSAKPVYIVSRPNGTLGWSDTLVAANALKHVWFLMGGENWRIAPRSWAIFDMVLMGNGVVMLRSLHAKHVVALTHNGVLVVGDSLARRNIDESINFVPVALQGSGFVSLRTHEGRYIALHAAGVVRADAKTIQDAAKFYVSGS